MKKSAVIEVILMVGFSSMQGRVLFTLRLTQKSSPMGCRTLFFFFSSQETGNMDIYCSKGPKNFKEAISGSWLKNDLILLQAYCQHNAVLALQDV